MPIEWLVVRFQDHAWKLWRSEAVGGLLAPAAKSMATLGANGDANGPQRGPGFQELPTVERFSRISRPAPPTHLP
jgi:hypothetical protein